MLRQMRRGAPLSTEKGMVMVMIKKITAIFTVAAMLFSVTAFADTPETGLDETNITTEYYSDDLLEPIAEASASADAELDLNARSAILMEKNTGRVLYEQNPHERVAPASITKIMSLLLITEAIEKGSLTLEENVKASEHAVSMGGSQIWLEVGEIMTVNELLKAVAVGSANDATVALGEHIAGSEEGFVSMMNARAAELGMENTHFVNCTGLDAENHYTSAYDVALMSRELIGHELIKQYSSIWMDSLRGGETKLVNTNKLVRFYEGATGLKTGTTDSAGHCLSATAERSGLELIAVVMGSDSGSGRFASARKLLDHGFANYVMINPETSPNDAREIKINGGVEQSLMFEGAQIDPVLVTKGGESSATVEIDLPESIDAPVTADRQIGTVTVKFGGEVLSQTPILAGRNIEKMTFAAALRILVQRLLGM